MAVYWEILTKVVYYSGNCCVLRFFCIMYCTLLTAFPIMISIRAVSSTESLTLPQTSFSDHLSLKMASAVLERRRAGKLEEFFERPLLLHECKHARV